MAKNNMVKLYTNALLKYLENTWINGFQGQDSCFVK